MALWLLPNAQSFGLVNFTHLTVPGELEHRTLRVARTIADLAAGDTVGSEAVAEALSMRHETLRSGNVR